MAPIRVAIIGLSASAKTAWTSKAHLPYLLSPQGRAKFEIVALLNSSVDAAKAAIATYNLPATTRAVDLVVCNTRVDKHFETIDASVKAGKAVFSEWPFEDALELTQNCLRLRQRVLGPDHPHTVSTLSALSGWTRKVPQAT
jgi:predicted dehydrogenase